MEKFPPNHDNTSVILFRKIKELERIRRLNTIQEVGNEGNDRDDEEMDEGIINHGGLFLEGMDAGEILLGETDAMITGLDTPEWLLSWNNWGDLDAWKLRLSKLTDRPPADHSLLETQRTGPSGVNGVTTV